MSYGYYPEKHQMERIAVIDKVYEQQEYMYKNNVHTVQDRIVSISQPYVRPICGYHSNDDRIGAMNLYELGTMYVSRDTNPRFGSRKID
jgi:hypothetical protein